jgi:hypothetical protein
MAVAAGFFGAIIVMNLFIKEKPPERYPLSSAKEALSILGKPKPIASTTPVAPAAPPAVIPAAKPAVEAPKTPAPQPPVAAKPPEPAPVKVATAVPPPKAAPAPAPVPQPAPAKEAAKVLAVGGDYVVHAGIFRSQFYLISLEERLKAMKLP